MEIDYASLLPFVFITTFTPGPNTLLAASMGIQHGYRRTLPFLLGIFTGFVLVFILCALMATTLATILPQFRNILSILGAVYILYLAYKTFHTSFQPKEIPPKPFGYPNGLLLQILNPKVIVYGLTIFSTYLVDIPKNLNSLLLFPIAFALISFSATTSYALFGSSITSLMKIPKFAKSVQVLFATSLVLIALDMATAPYLG